MTNKAQNLYFAAATNVHETDAIDIDWEYIVYGMHSLYCHSHSLYPVLPPVKPHTCQIPALSAIFDLLYRPQIIVRTSYYDVIRSRGFGNGNFTKAFMGDELSAARVRMLVPIF